jgi:3-oxoacyl-[acyl-carrier-protein] synthase II
VAAVPALIAASEVRTCLGDGAATFGALLRGATGVAPLRVGVPAALNVASGYHVGGGDGSWRPTQWLVECVAAAIAGASLDVEHERVACLVGTGLRELHSVERWALDGGDLDVDRLDFAAALRAAVPGLGPVTTVANACSAGGHVLALAQDMVELGLADAVVVGATDGMTESMLAMIGRVTDEPTDRVRPFDAGRRGVLLGEGAAAVVVVPEARAGRAAARLLATGLSCDAHHETAPALDGILRAIDDALARAGKSGSDVALVVAHGTGTLLNDPTEAEAIRLKLTGSRCPPLVTAIKGAIGHTSGASMLHGLDVAIRAVAGGVVPPIAGLGSPLPEGGGLRFVAGAAAHRPLGLAAINSFGFGGVNSVTLIEAP